jgi:nucleoside-triphosphatase THEP1
MNPKRIILTGEPQEGKSTLLARVLERLSDMRIAGILAKGLWRNGLRHGFDLMDLASGLTTPLARRNPRATPGRVPFTFFDQGMKAGIHALDTAQCRNADLVCVDEVGKLEIKDRGWAPLLSPLLELDRPVHLWVVRRELVTPVSLKWRFDDPTVVSVNDSTALTTLVRCIRNNS